MARKNQGTADVFDLLVCIALTSITLISAKAMGWLDWSWWAVTVALWGGPFLAALIALLAAAGFVCTFIGDAAITLATWSMYGVATVLNLFFEDSE